MGCHSWFYHQPDTPELPIAIVGREGMFDPRATLPLDCDRSITCIITAHISAISTERNLALRVIRLCL
jgi:hypothetical protein